MMNRTRGKPRICLFNGHDTHGMLRSMRPRQKLLFAILLSKRSDGDGTVFRVEV